MGRTVREEEYRVIHRVREDTFEMYIIRYRYIKGLYLLYPKILQMQSTIA